RALLFSKRPSTHATLRSVSSRFPYSETRVGNEGPKRKADEQEVVMKTRSSPMKISAALATLSLACTPLLALAQDGAADSDIMDSQSSIHEQQRQQVAANDSEQQTAQEEASGPVEDVEEAAGVLRAMEQNADMKRLLDDAKGVFLVPDYATAALIIGGAGGEGVLLKKQTDGQWSNPVFYNIGSLSGGLQAGAAAGSIAMVLMSDQALDSFQDETSFGLTADAGYSIVNWSDRNRAEIGLGTDVVMWTDTDGLFGDLSVGVTGITPDDDEMAEYYGQEVQP